MKAYINTLNLGAGNGFVAQVVSEQDYHERGYASHAHQSKRHPTPEGAKAAATEWAEENGYSIYSVDEIAA